MFRVPTMAAFHLSEDSTATPSHRKFPIAQQEQIGNIGLRSESLMLVLDPPMIVAVAAVVSSFSALVWALRRKP